MGTLYLVRHGQASFGADDYDRLSPLGRQQSVLLGRYFAEKGLAFEGVITGTLRRHRETLDGIREGLAEQGTGLVHNVLDWQGLNEYDSAAVIAAIHPQPLTRPDTPEAYRAHFRLLRDGLTQWMAGVVSPAGMPSYQEFAAGVRGALSHVKEHFHGKPVLIVSSGGPIATAVGQVLGTSPEATIELNMRIRNSAVTEFAFTPKRHMLLTFNTLPHLDRNDQAGLVTYT